MRKLSVFNNVTLDGYFTSSKGDIDWANKSDDRNGKPSLMETPVTAGRSFWVE